MLGITEQFRDNWVLLQINGEIDMATGPELRQRIVHYVQEGHVNILIDLSSSIKKDRVVAQNKKR